MGVEVEQGHGAVALRHGAQFGQGDGVVAAHDHRDGPGVEHARDGGFDALEGLVEIAGDDIHIARVDTLAVLENIHVKNAVVGLQDAGGIRMAAGPNRHPGRYEVAVSKGTPSTAKSLPEQSAECGSR